MKKNFFTLIILLISAASCKDLSIGNDDLCNTIEKDFQKAIENLADDASEGEIQQITEIYNMNKTFGGCN